MATQQGIVVRWNETSGFGFLSQEDKNDIFVHRTALINGDRLHLGDRCSFESIWDESKQKFMARSVRVIEYGVEEASKMTDCVGILPTPVPKAPVPKINLLRVPSSQCSTAASSPCSARSSIAASMPSPMASFDPLYGMQPQMSAPMMHDPFLGLPMHQDPFLQAAPMAQDPFLATPPMEHMMHDPMMGMYDQSMMDPFFAQKLEMQMYEQSMSELAERMSAELTQTMFPPGLDMPTPPSDGRGTYVSRFDRDCVMA